MDYISQTNSVEHNFVYVIILVLPAFVCVGLVGSLQNWVGGPKNTSNILGEILHK